MADIIAPCVVWIVSDDGQWMVYKFIRSTSGSVASEIAQVANRLARKQPKMVAKFHPNDYSRLYRAVGRKLLELDRYRDLGISIGHRDGYWELWVHPHGPKRWRAKS